MDQLGLMVRKIESNGLIRVERVGGVTGGVDRGEVVDRLVVEVDGLLGEQVDVIDQGKLLHTGIARGTDSIGRLKIETRSGILPILVGDISIKPRNQPQSSPARDA